MSQPIREREAPAEPERYVVTDMAMPLILDLPRECSVRSIYVIGDVHGEHEALEDLVDSLRLEPDDIVVQIGDCVGRGPQSFEVVEYWLAFHRRPRYVLGGNQEERLRDRRMPLLPAPGRPAGLYRASGLLSPALVANAGAPSHVEDRVRHVQHSASSGYKEQSSAGSAFDSSESSEDAGVSPSSDPAGRRRAAWREGPTREPVTPDTG